jgi:phage/plasmid-like protein (TIGR03299 family)
MAHNLFYSEQTGQHSFFSVNQKAWHGLGHLVDQYPTSREALLFAGLDYSIEKRKLFTAGNINTSGHGDTLKPTLEVPDYYATIRTDTETVLGVVGKNYRVVQNIDAFTFFDSIVGGDGIQYETAGALGKGERIFITAKLPGYIQVGKEDLIEKYLFLTTSHDGFGAITAAFTPVRIVCANTLSAALHNSTNSIKIRHTANAKERLTQAHKLMGITAKLSESLESVFNKWATIPMRDCELKKLIQLALAPTIATQYNPEQRESLSAQFQHVCEQAFAYAVSNPTQLAETTKGTLFGAYNAVTGYYQNVRRYKDKEAKLKSIVLGGTAQQRSEKAFRLCHQFMCDGKSAWGLN